MRVFLALVVWLSMGVSATHAGVPGEQTGAAARLSIPSLRLTHAMSGSEFARRTASLSGAAREAAALEALANGNVPAFLRELKPIRIRAVSNSQRLVEIVFWVTPDYLAIGSDRDFLRIPLGYPTAVAVAGLYGAVLPTRKMVDTIFAQSSCQLTPKPLPPGPEMTSNKYFLKHRQKVEKQRLRDCSLGELVAGHKKDLVITNRLHRNPGRVAIYGWHRKVGDPIQPLSTVHGARYADYSHGVRLVSHRLLVNGEPRSIFEVLQDPDLGPLLTYEGEIVRPRALLSVGF